MRWLTILVVAAIATAGCSSDSSPDRAVELFGSFRAAQVGMDEVTGHTATDAIQFRFEGGSMASDLDRDGVYEDSTTYSAAANYTFRANDGTTGVVNRTGHVIVSGKLTNTAEPAISAAIRLSRGIDVGVMRGTYLVCLAGGDSETGLCWTRLQTGVVDGTRLNWSIVSDSEGSAGVTGSWVLDVLDGEVVVKDAAGEDVLYVGAVTYDGELIVAADPAAEGDDSPDEILIAIRLGERQTRDLQGSYEGYSFGSDVVGAATVCHTSRFDLEADGMGQAAIEEMRADGTRLGAEFAYHVGSSGSLFRDGERYGAIGAGGDMFVGIDTDWTDGSIGLYFGIRTAK